MVNKQQGAALLTAILITAVVAVLASNILLNQKQWIAQTGLADRQNHFNTIANRIQDWAFIAASMRSNTKDVTQLPPAWPSFAKTMQGVKVKAQLMDGNTLYNLNWLINPTMDASFARLIKAVDQNIDDKRAMFLAQSVTAAIQMSQGIRPSVSQKAKGPQDMAGVPVVGPFHALVQLKFIKGFTPKLIAALSPYVSILPVKAGINITTGNKLVMQALLKPTQDEPTEWMAYLSCRQAFASQHPKAAAWSACLQQNSGQNFLTNFGASNQLASDTNSSQQPVNDSQQTQQVNDQSSSGQSLLVYRSNYAILRASMVQTDLSSQIMAAYWLPNKKTPNLPNAQNQREQQSYQQGFAMRAPAQAKVTLVSYWRS